MTWWNPGRSLKLKPGALAGRSLGVCNGCQLMALLGWVPGTGTAAQPQLPSREQPRFLHNESGRCRPFARPSICTQAGPSRGHVSAASGLHRTASHRMLTSEVAPLPPSQTRCSQWNLSRHLHDDALQHDSHWRSRRVGFRV